MTDEGSDLADGGACESDVMAKSSNRKFSVKSRTASEILHFKSAVLAARKRNGVISLYDTCIVSHT